MDENGEILLLHASKNNARLFVLPFYMTLLITWCSLSYQMSLRPSQYKIKNHLSLFCFQQSLDLIVVRLVTCVDRFGGISSLRQN